MTGIRLREGCMQESGRTGGPTALCFLEAYQETWPWIRAGPPPQPGAGDEPLAAPPRKPRSRRPSGPPVHLAVMEMESVIAGMAAASRHSPRPWPRPCSRTSRRTGGYRVIVKASVARDPRPLPKADVAHSLERIDALATDPRPHGSEKPYGQERPSAPAAASDPL